jgi:hypothetical protein
MLRHATHLIVWPHSAYVRACVRPSLAHTKIVVDGWLLVEWQWSLSPPISTIPLTSYPRHTVGPIRSLTAHFSASVKTALFVAVSKGLRGGSGGWGMSLGHTSLHFLLMHCRKTPSRHSPLLSRSLCAPNRLYCLLRLIDGDQESRRVKFIGLTFVGEDVGGMQRGRVAGHKGDIFKLCGVSRATPRHATPRHATPRHATPRHATPRHATPRHAACLFTGSFTRCSPPLPS